MIPKFKDVLVNEELEPERTRDALKTLNEHVHHQVRQESIHRELNLNNVHSIVGNCGHDDRTRNFANRS